MIYALIFLLILGAVLLVAAAVAPLHRRGAQMALEHLEAYDAAAHRRYELAAPVGERLLQPALHRLARVARLITPVGRIERLRDRVEAAGRPWNLDVNGLLAVKVLALLAGLLALAVLGSLRVLPLLWFVVVAVAVVLLTYYLPDLLLVIWRDERKARIARSLPDLLDLLTVTVEAGLGLDSALAKIASKIHGPLHEEILITLHHMRMGESRENALRELARRCGVDDLNTFTTALIQSQRLGVSLGRVLRVQSETLRVARRQRIQERAQKAPVKMVFPLLLCIFPALFVVILGPAAIRIYHALIG